LPINITLLALAISGSCPLVAAEFRFMGLADDGQFFLSQGGSPEKMDLPGLPKPKGLKRIAQRPHRITTQSHRPPAL
jgi:hypothetical protein